MAPPQLTYQPVSRETAADVLRKGTARCVLRLPSGSGPQHFAVRGNPKTAQKWARRKAKQLNGSVVVRPEDV